MNRLLQKKTSSLKKMALENQALRPQLEKKLASQSTKSRRKKVRAQGKEKKLVLAKKRSRTCFLTSDNRPGRQGLRRLGMTEKGGMPFGKGGRGRKKAGSVRVGGTGCRGEG